MSKPLLGLAAALAFAAAAPASALMSETKPLVEQVDVTGFSGTVARYGHLTIASQPNEAALAEMAKQGVVTVINLRTPREMASLSFDEPALVEELGMTYVHVPLDGGEFPHSPEALAKVNAAIAAANGAPVLLHCASARRASHMFAAWLVSAKDMPASEAIPLARQIGMETLAVENLLGTHFEMNVPAE